MGALGHNGAAPMPTNPPAPLHITLPADPETLAVSRGRLREWLNAAGFDPETAADVLLAAGEATANATEHAVLGADSPVLITVSAAICGGVLELTVSDTGCWKPATVSSGHRGHGMHLINALMTSVELKTSPGGTTVFMSKELTR